MRAIVLVEQGSDVRHVASDGAVIGRDSVCEIEVTDDEISRRHARLHLNDAQLTIEDLGSVNGTFVNGSRISKQAVLKQGDRIKVGSVTLTVAGDGGVTRLSKSAAPDLMQTAPPPLPAPTASSFAPATAGSGGGRRSAATRSGATIASYATILATAVAVAAYLAGR